MAESVYTTAAEERRLRWLDTRANRLRGEGAMEEQENDLHFFPAQIWDAKAEAAGGQVERRRHRGRWLHRQYYCWLTKSVIAKKKHLDEPTAHPSTDETR